MEDKELVKMFNPILKRRETILFFLIVVINRLTWIVSEIGLDTCTRERWKVEVSKLKNESDYYCICTNRIQSILPKKLSTYYIFVERGTDKL